MRDEAREAVVVAEVDLASGDRVVLIDDGDRPCGKQRVERCPHVPVFLGVNHVVLGEQHLPHEHVAHAEGLRPFTNEHALPDRSERLAIGDRLGSRVKPHRAKRRGDRARADNDDLAPLVNEARHARGECPDRVAVEVTAWKRERTRTDFHHDALCARERGSRIESCGVVHTVPDTYLVDSRHQSSFEGSDQCPA